MLFILLINLILKFYKIQNHNIAKFICDSIKDNSININDLINEKYSSSDIYFCIKQLAENNILYKNKNYIYKSDSFYNYRKFQQKFI